MNNVIEIKRTERDECARRLREFAGKISSGDVAFAAIYVMDWRGGVEEIVMKDDQVFCEKTA